MKGKRDRVDRRGFLKAVGAAGLGSVFGSGRAQGDTEPMAEKEIPAKVPRCKLGQTGVEVPVLSLGGVYDADNQIIYRVALRNGIDCWDTANIYGNGTSEMGIGKFFERNPEARKDVIIITKSSIFGAGGPGSYAKVTAEELDKRLNLSLERMKTDYVDVYYGVHELVRIDQLSEQVREWAEDAKQRKVIRLFGISTHRNTKELAQIARMDWVEVVQIPYNFRLMQNPDIKAAVEACYKSGKGVVAMKTLGLGQKTHTAEEEKIFEHFIKKGFTAEQAKIKYVLDDECVSTACVGMEVVPVVEANAAAVSDRAKLSRVDKEMLERFASATCDGYCAGCTEICEAALPGMPYTGKIMQFLMYCNSYGQKDRARQLFAQIPAAARDRLLKVNYRAAEARCPQRMPIAKLMAEAVTKLA